MDPPFLLENLVLIDQVYYYKHSYNSHNNLNLSRNEKRPNSFILLLSINFYILINSFIFFSYRVSFYNHNK